MAKKENDDYATLLAPGTKKIAVCFRRSGTRDRWVQIALCTNEVQADKIVDGLNLLSGKLTELEAPAQRVLEEVRRALASERSVVVGLNRKVREMEADAREKSNMIGRLTLERDRAVVDRDNAVQARNTMMAASEKV